MLQSMKARCRQPIKGWIIILMPICFQSACGIYVPAKELLYENKIDPRNGMSRSGKIESNIIANIRCEVQKGIYEAVALGSVPWLAGWGTIVTLNLTWEETSSLKPDITRISPLVGTEIFTFNVGASGTARATRLEKITFTWENDQLLKEAIFNRNKGFDLSCDKLSDGTMIESDLRINEFIYDKATVAKGEVATTRPLTYPQFSTFQETITFVATYGGGITPSWKFTKISANTSNPLLSATRTVTSEVLITLGPIEKPATRVSPPVLALQAQVQHNAAFAGLSTASALISQSR